jgi:putative oxidoreductase
MKIVNTYFIWAVRILTSLILLQTLYFKFTAQPESVYIFSKLGLEPYGRIGSGIAELIAGILILIPRYTWIGAGMALCVISGAIVAHLTNLGIEVLGDGGQLFLYALIVFVGSIILLYHHRKQIPFINKILR